MDTTTSIVAVPADVTPENGEKLSPAHGFTPGPWEYRWEATRFVIQHRPEDSPGMRAIAVTAGAYHDKHANALLIAAAPDLFEALEAFDRLGVAVFPEGPGSQAASRDLDPESLAVWINARAVLAKARGGA